MMKVYNYILLLLFCANLTAQNSIFLEWQGELVGVCDPVITYTLTDAETGASLGVVSETAEPFNLYAELPDEVCKVNIAVEVTAVECDTGEPCPVKTSNETRTASNCCTTVCLQDGTEVFVPFDDLIDFFEESLIQTTDTAALRCLQDLKSITGNLPTEYPAPLDSIFATIVNAINANIDWENMPAYPTPPDSLGVTILNQNTFGSSCEDPIFTQSCDKQIVYSDTALVRRFDSLLVKQDSLFNCLKDFKNDTCETYIVEKCVLCWGDRKTSNEYLEFPTKFDCCTNNYDYFTKEDEELIFAGENQNALEVDCTSCGQHIFYQSGFNRVSKIVLCGGVEVKVQQPFEALEDIDLSAIYHPTLNFPGFGVFFEKFGTGFYHLDNANICVKEIWGYYLPISTEVTLLNDVLHPIQSYGDCCQCPDPIKSYEFAYFCNLETNTTFQSEYINEDGVRVDTIYRYADGTVLTDFPKSTFGECCCEMATKETLTSISQSNCQITYIDENGEKNTIDNRDLIVIESEDSDVLTDNRYNHSIGNGNELVGVGTANDWGHVMNFDGEIVAVSMGNRSTANTPSEFQVTVNETQVGPVLSLPALAGSQNWTVNIPVQTGDVINFFTIDGNNITDSVVNISVKTCCEQETIDPCALIRCIPPLVCVNGECVRAVPNK